MNMEISETLSMISFMITVLIRTTISQTTTDTEIFGETDGCPVNKTWTPESQSCYLFLTDYLNFTQANESCQELGAHLVFIGSEEENKYIQKFTGNLTPWIGLYRTTNEYCAGSSCGNWMWLDGSVPEYSHWAEGVSNTDNQCAVINSFGYWDHLRLCSLARAYVCEKKRIFPRPAQDGCPLSLTWTPESRSCYRLLTDALNFTEANESCKELGAHLVFIGSEEENKYIKEFARNLFPWIGLYRPTNDYCAGSSCGNWMWLDGSVLQYSKWAEGASNTDNQCAVIDSQGYWDHLRLCSVARTYVCEQKRIFLSTTQEPATIRSTSDIIHRSSSDAESATIRSTSDIIHRSSSDAVATMDSSVANDDSITYIGVGVSTAIIAISVFVGLGVCYMRTRRGENRNPQANSRAFNQWSYAADTEVYENGDHGALSNPADDQRPTYRKAVQLNTLSGTVDDADTIIGAGYKEDNSAYEEVHNYAEVNPEYTCLQVPKSADTQHETNALYANVERH